MDRAEMYYQFYNHEELIARIIELEEYVDDLHDWLDEEDTDGRD